MQSCHFISMYACARCYSNIEQESWQLYLFPEILKYYQNIIYNKYVKYTSSQLNYHDQ